MFRIPRLLIVTLAASGLGLGATAALADYSGCDHGRHDPAKMAAWHKKRQTELHARLKLTSAQEPAWQTYLEKTTPSPADRPDWKAMASLSTPERLDRVQELMKQRETRMNDRIAATKAFYSTLTPDQQKVFDQQFARHERGPKKRPKKSSASPVSLNQPTHPIWS